MVKRPATRQEEDEKLVLQKKQADYAAETYNSPVKRHDRTDTISRREESIPTPVDDARRARRRCKRGCYNPRLGPGHARIMTAKTPWDVGGDVKGMYLESRDPFIIASKTA